MKKIEPKNLTPVMRQYLAIKQRYPDTILLFRMGDFYEMFYEDAVSGAQILGIALTTRDRGKENPAPMAGVPYHSVTTYIKKLLNAGKRVAICEQLEDASKTKTIVARDVVRIITPGVNIETDLLDARRSNYIICIFPSEPDKLSFPAGFACAEISTGQMMATVINDGSILASEIVRTEPTEILIPEKNAKLEQFVRERVPEAAITPISNTEKYTDFSYSSKRIQEVELAGQKPIEEEDETSTWIKNLPKTFASACASMLDYLKATQPLNPIPIKRIGTYQPSQYMILDEMTVKHLELTLSTSGSRKGSLLWLIDKTVTSMGSRLCRSWLLAPLMEVAQIRRRQDIVEFFFESHSKRAEIRNILSPFCDIERIVSRAIAGIVNPKEVRALADTLTLCEKLFELICDAPLYQLLKQLLGEIKIELLRQNLSTLGKKLDEAIVDSPPPVAREGGIIRKGYNSELDELIELSNSSKSAIATLEQKERQTTSIASLKIKYNKVFGYFIEVTKTNLHLVPHERYIRKQTIAGGERFITEELKKLEEKILSAEEKRKSLEEQIFSQVVGEIASEEKQLRAMGQMVATLDVICALAEFAAHHRCTKPKVTESGKIYIKEGTHPVVEALSSERFVPNDVELDTDGERIWIITGPNMSGKSTFMRQVALHIILTQMGSFIPAEQAQISICDRIFTRVGASDNLAWGQSTFMVEMNETATILRSATARSLVVLDEIGRGTSTYDGLSIAWAVVEYLHDKVGCKSLIATHYHELTQIAKNLPHVANYNVSAIEYGNRIIFLRKLKKGGSSKSYGIEVAKISGIPEEVIKRAREILSRIEKKEQIRIGETASSKTPQSQLGLFEIMHQESNTTRIKKILEEVEIEKTTPIEALNTLARLKELIKKQN